MKLKPNGKKVQKKSAGRSWFGPVKSAENCKSEDAMENAQNGKIAGTVAKSCQKVSLNDTKFRFEIIKI